VQILIPMAGAGSRFKEKGYQLPKPLIDVNGRPMITRVIHNLGASNDFVFVVQRLMWQQYQQQFEQAAQDCSTARFLVVEGLTRGAAETCLLACKDLDPNKELMIANCDQIMDWSPSHFATWWNTTPSDGTVITFYSNSIKNSYVRIDSNGWIVEAREKAVISDLATTGVYLWRTVDRFVRAADTMIEQNLRTNNEFYVCPVYNQNLVMGDKINTYHVNRHWPIGTPEDLPVYQQHLQTYGDPLIL